MEKLCPKCQIVKPLTDFFKCSARKDGVRYDCKVCSVAARAKWADENRDRVRELGRNWIAKDPESNRRKTREWVTANPERKAQADAEYRKKNTEKVKQAQRAYREANAEKLRLTKAAYRAANLDQIREKQRERYAATREQRIAESSAYKRANRGRYNELHAKRKALKRKAMPKWLSPQHRADIKQRYVEAEAFSLFCSEPYQVDHIVPLVSPTVCGLHVPWNLQVIPATQNASKGNRYDPDGKD